MTFLTKRARTYAICIGRRGGSIFGGRQGSSRRAWQRCRMFTFARLTDAASVRASGAARLAIPGPRAANKRLPVSELSSSHPSPDGGGVAEASANAARPTDGDETPRPAPTRVFAAGGRKPDHVAFADLKFERPNATDTRLRDSAPSWLGIEQRPTDDVLNDKGGAE